MSRQNSLSHPLVQVRTLAGLGRQQLASRIGVKPVTVEKWERGERSFTAEQRYKVFRACGVCPGWMANPIGPIHTADGHPYTREEFDRWSIWRDKPVPNAVGEALPGIVGMGGRRLGPHYDRGCCSGAVELLREGPLETVRPKMAKALQNCLQSWRLKGLHEGLMELARGVGNCLRKPEDEDRILRAISRLRECFPEAKLVPDPMDAKLVESR
jgi:DNA-binding XRE family transcriptional regulator